MDQSQMLSIVGGLYDKLVKDVAAVVQKEIGATALANIALDPTIFRSMVQDLVESDSAMRDTIRDLITDHMDGYDITNNREFSVLAQKVDDLDTEQDDLKSKVDELEEQSIDADNDEFADAVRAVIRNNI